MEGIKKLTEGILCSVSLLRSDLKTWVKQNHIHIQDDIDNLSLSDLVKMVKLYAAIRRAP